MHFAFLSLAKFSVIKKGVNAFDIVYFANMISIVGSTAYALVTGRGFKVTAELRKALATRSVVGLIGLTSFTLGAALVPISVQLTVGNMAPFFASIMAYLVIGEKMSLFEIIAMTLSFAGVVMIALGQKNALSSHDGDLGTEPAQSAFDWNAKVASTVGILMCITVSIANGVLAILTRMMQSIHVSVMMSYIALVSIVILTVAFLIEKAFVGGQLRILSYNGDQYMYGFLAGTVNIIGLVCKIIAY